MAVQQKTVIPERKTAMNHTTAEKFLDHARQEISYFSWFFVNFVVNKVEIIFGSGIISQIRRRPFIDQNDRF
jgi:hypothetical protein